MIKGGQIHLFRVKTEKSFLIYGQKICDKIQFVLIGYRDQ